MNDSKAFVSAMQPIGGYFSLELECHEEFHAKAIKLNTGRNCLEYILRCRNYKKVYIPFYTCGVVLEPFLKTGIEYSFYHINLEFEIEGDILLKEGEALLYTNYYGLKQSYIEILAVKYGQHLIVDNTQAFYAKPISGIDTFYTCRKFFGVPDGAYLYTDKTLDSEIEQDVSYERMTFLVKRIDLGAEAGYQDFREQTHLLVGQPIKQMSTLTERLMKSIDYNAIAQKRINNFIHLHESLRTTNLLNIFLEEDSIPMVYPYLTDKAGLRNYLIDNNVYVAKYWPNVLEWVKSNSLESYIVNNLIPIPIDQRYKIEDMNRIIRTINKNTI